MNRKLIIRAVALVLVIVMVLGFFAGVVSAAETGTANSSGEPAVAESTADAEIIVGDSESSSIGIIGGADGPTAIFVSGNPGAMVAIIAAVIAVICAVVVALKHRKK